MNGWIFDPNCIWVSHRKGKCEKVKNLNPVELIRQRVNDDEDITELGGQNPSAIISPMFRPDDVDFVVTQMSGLAQQALIRTGRHSENRRERLI